jgi:hypothetical protein
MVVKDGDRRFVLLGETSGGKMELKKEYDIFKYTATVCWRNRPRQLSVPTSGTGANRAWRHLRRKRVARSSGPDAVEPSEL